MHRNLYPNVWQQLFLMTDALVNELVQIKCKQRPDEIASGTVVDRPVNNTARVH